MRKVVRKAARKTKIIIRNFCKKLKEILFKT